ncbi:MAG: hypothetical protein IJC36_02800 [Clostridia bacterium]|nr:hypothetical protein [Clostridia bacterium]
MSAIKRFFKLLTTTALMLSVLLLSGCSGFSLTADDFLSPPRASGEMYEIEEVLKETVNTAYTLKYPTAGEYRSAYILADLTGVGEENFALAFYSTTNEENSTFMNLKLMQKVDNEWMSVSDVVVNAVGVEKIEITDLNGDGVKEIIVGWNIYGGMDKKVNAYALNGLNLLPIMQENYTSFMCCDLIGNNRKELFLLYHDTVNITASAKYFSFEGDKVKTSSSCVIDGTATSFNEPTFVVLPNKIPAIHIDAVKGAGMQTEIVYCQNGKLVSAFYKPTIAENYVHPTYRNNTVTSLDINGDGYLDIPLNRPIDIVFPGLDESTLNPITNWCSFNGRRLVSTMQAVMNYSDGYYFEFPRIWAGRTTINIEIENRIRTVCLWDTKNGTIISELVKIRAISDVNWDKPDNGFNDYKEITRKNGVVYAAMFSDYEGAEKITLEELKKIFHIIE